MAFYDSGTCKQRRKFSEIKKDNNLKRKRIENIRSLLKAGKIALSKKAIDEYLEIYGEDCYILHEEGKYYSSSGMIDESNSCFNKNIYNNAKNKYYSMYELSKNYKYKRKYKEARELLEEIINSNHPEKFHAELELGKIQMILNNYDESEDILLNLIKNKSPNRVYVSEALIELYLELNRTGEAKNYLNNIKNDIDKIMYDYYVACIYSKEDKKEEAKKMLEDISSKNSICKMKANFELAKIEYNLENYESVMSLAKTFLSDNSFYCLEGLKLLCSCNIKLNDYNEAEIYIKNIKEKFPEYLDCTDYLYGKFYMKQSNFELALSYFTNIGTINKAIRRDSLYRMVCCLIKCERYEEAYRTLNLMEHADFNKKYERHVNTIRLYLEKKLNIPYTVPTSIYFEKQVVDYSYNKAIKHIKNHSYDSKVKNKSLFSKEIIIEEIYQYALDHINESNYIDNTFADEYILDYPNAAPGIDYIKVVTIPNSKDIIAIYPYNKLFTKKTKSKEKTLSRIDRFNKKYGIH